MTVPGVNSSKETVCPFLLCDANVESPHHGMDEDFRVWPPTLLSTTSHALVQAKQAGGPEYLFLNCSVDQA